MVRALSSLGSYRKHIIKEGHQCSLDLSSPDSTFSLPQVEPFDMNETKLTTFLASHHTTCAVAVSPIVKVTCSDVTRRPLSVIIPKPGHAIYGSVKLGLRTSLRGKCAAFLSLV